MVAVRTSEVPLVVKKPPTNAKDIRDVVSIPGLGIASGGGLDNPLQYSCLENSMDREAWQARVRSVIKSQTGLKRQYNCTHIELLRKRHQERCDITKVSIKLKR